MTTKRELREALQRLQSAAHDLLSGCDAGIQRTADAEAAARAILARPARVVAFRVVTPGGSRLRWDVRNFSNEEQAHGYAKAARKALPAGGAMTTPPREVCGYRVRWTDNGVEQAADVHVGLHGDAGYCRMLAYGRASALLKQRLCGMANVRIRKLTRPVRDKSTGGEVGRSR